MGFQRPNKVMTAKELANLQPGGKQPGAGRPKKSKQRSEAEKFAWAVMRDPLYRRNLYARARRGALQPGVEVYLMQLCFGKPKETLEVTQIAPVRIIHKFAVAAKMEAEEIQEAYALPAAVEGEVEE